MNSVDFLKKELEVLSIRFPFVHFKYGYDSMIETHLVELLPLSEYINNVDLDAAWIPLSLQFIETYNEEIAFFSSDSQLSINKIIFEFNSNVSLEEEIINELFAPLSEKLYTYDFSMEIPNGRVIKSNPVITILSDQIEKFNGKDLPECPSYLAAA